MRWCGSIARGRLTRSVHRRQLLKPPNDGIDQPGTRRASRCGSAIATSYPALGPNYVPLFFSQALNAGNEKVCAAVPVARKDVYDVRRPLGKACAIGAAEGNVSHLVHRMRSREGVFATGNAR